MTSWYHLRKTVYSIILIATISIIYLKYNVTGIKVLIAIICILLFFINIAAWLDDTKKWNKGTCSICNSPWKLGEESGYDEKSYHCNCGRTIWF